MEDSKNSVTPSGNDAPNENGVIELTPDMEIVSGRTPHIIDLTEVLQSGDDRPEPIPAAAYDTPQPSVAALSHTTAPAKTSAAVKEKSAPAVDSKPPKSVVPNSWEDILARKSFEPSESPGPSEETPHQEAPIDLTDEMETGREEVPVVDLEGAESGDALDLTDAVQPIDLVTEAKPPIAAPEVGSNQAEPLVLEGGSASAPDVVTPIDLVTEAESPTSVPDEQSEYTESPAVDDDIAAIEQGFPDLETADAGDTLDLTEIVNPVELMADEMTTDETPEPEPPPARTHEVQAVPQAALDQIATLDELKDEDTIVLTEMVLPTDMVPEEAEPADEAIESEPARLDAFDLETADAGDTLNLTDVVHPMDLMAEEASAAESTAAAEDDTLMLTDMVLPTDLVEHKAPETQVADTVSDETDDELFEVTEPVESDEAIEAPADEVLELTEMVQPEQADTDAGEAEDEEVLDLTDMAFPDESTEPDMGMADIEDEVLELTEMIQPEDTDTDENASALDEEVLDLTDMVLSEEDSPADLQETDAETAMPESLDDDVLSLTDMVLPGDDAAIDPDDTLIDEAMTDGVDEEVLDLTEMVLDEPEVPIDEAPVELVDKVDLDDAMAADLLVAAVDDDDVIELLDMVDPETVAAEIAGAQGAGGVEAAWDDDTIELTDIVSPQELAALRAAAQGGDTQDQLIRLDSVLEQVRRNKDRIIADIAADLEGQLPENERDALGKMGPINFNLDLEEIRAAIGETGDLNEKELERVVEEIIRTKYSEAIEKAIGLAVEKAVKREMESIKRNLSEDLDTEKDE